MYGRRHRIDCFCVAVYKILNDLKMKKIILLLAILANSGSYILSGNMTHLNADDAIYINGVVITVNSDNPYVEAFAVINGRFAAVGTNDEIRRLAVPSTKIIDLKGMTVTPGFYDTHIHPAPLYPAGSPYYIPRLDTVQTMDDLIAELKKKADVTPPGQLISGRGYDSKVLGRHPNRYDLDKVSTVHPIRINESNSSYVVNSYVIEASGITKNTPDSINAIYRDVDGTPNGMFSWSFRGINTGATAREERIPYEAQVEGIVNLLNEYAGRGMTSITATRGSVQLFQMFQDARKSGNRVRINFVYGDGLETLKDAGIKSGFGDDYMRIMGIGSSHGASFSGHTCWVSIPYEGRSDYYGVLPSRSQEELDKLVQSIHDAGLQYVTDCNGDRELEMVITAIERAQAKNPRPDPRHRIDHASLMTAPLLERAKKAGIIIAFHSYIYEQCEQLEAYGDRMIHAYRTALDMGVHIAAHSDGDFSKVCAMTRLQSVVTRKGKNGKVYGANERISVEEAINVWTLGGAYISFEENDKGSITPGKLADFIVLRQDPRKVNPDTIKDIVVDATYIGGVNVWQAQ